VNGGFGSWTKFGECSETCGEGSQLRTRMCNKPRPAHGGKTCSGSIVNRRSCKL